MTIIFFYIRYSNHQQPNRNHEHYHCQQERPDLPYHSRPFPFWYEDHHGWRSSQVLFLPSTAHSVRGSRSDREHRQVRSPGLRHRDHSPQW